MKKVLLAGTAMGMAAFYAGQAVAQDESSLSFGAFFNTRLSVGSASTNNDVDAGIKSNGDLSTNSEIAVTGSKSTDMGTLGLHIELETDEASTGNVDENSVTIAADWGTVMFGNNDGAEDPKVSAFSFQTQGMSWDLSGSAAAARQAAGATAKGGTTSYYGITSEGGDETKIMYTTPDFGGATARVSYTPEISQSSSATTFNVTDALGLGVSYAGDMGDVAVAFAAGYSSADYGNPSWSATQESDNGTTDGYHIGATITMGMYSVGAGYLSSQSDDGSDGLQEDREYTVWNAGGKIAVNDMLSISATYSNEEADEQGTTVGANDESIEEMAFGVSYTVTDGLSVSAAFLTGEVDEKVATSDDGEYDAATFQVGMSF